MILDAIHRFRKLLKSVNSWFDISSFQVAETRSENRTYRPRVELCRDAPHDGIIAERNDLMNTVATLIDQHNIAEYVIVFHSFQLNISFVIAFSVSMPIIEQSNMSYFTEVLSLTLRLISRNWWLSC